jgi:hypothetical protein
VLGNKGYMLLLLYQERYCSAPAEIALMEDEEEEEFIQNHTRARRDS